MAKLPDDEIVWALCPPTSLPENDETVPIDTQVSSNSKKKSLSSCWPPADWKTAPGFSYARKWGISTQPVVTDQLQKSDGFSEAITSETADVILKEMKEDVIEDDLVLGPNSTLFPVLDNQSTGFWDQPQSSLDALADPTNVVVESLCPEEGQSKSIGKDHLLSITPGALQAMQVDRLGELVAFRYFTEKTDGVVVNWVNQDKETGLPYDIIIGEAQESMEYIEVKASRYAKKDWFVISTREWQFAYEKGDSYSIAHVILSGQNPARIIIYKNPVKLCQQAKLQLAVMTPRIYQEPSQTQ